MPKTRVKIPLIWFVVVLLFPGCHSKPKLPYSKDASTAIEQGNVATLKSLIDAGLDVNGVDKFGNTPLMWALVFGTPETVKLLIEEGADVNRPDSHRGIEGETPLMVACDRSNVEVLKLLVNNGANLNARTPSKGITALMYCLEAGSKDKVSVLLAAGADPNLADAKGRTPLDYAKGTITATQEETISMLVEHGAK